MSHRSKHNIDVYDGLGRLTLSESSDKKYSEKLTFDLDANVTDVRRLYRGATIQWASAQEMEGPRILELHDASGPYYSESVGRFPAGEYTYGYDRCGRTVSDGTRDATISYHKWLDLPRRINIGDGNFIQNSYLPDGTLTGRIFNTKRINTIVRVNSKGDTIVTQRRNDLRRSLRFFGSFEKEGTSLKVHTPEGYYAVKEGRHYQYIRNRQGSTMAVVNDAGEVVQRTGYYASGTPFVLPVDSSDGSVAPLDSITDRLHIGNRWLGHLGLAMYDNTARVYDPVMPHMLTCDKYASKFPNFSPFSHCAGNPANILDVTGDSIVVLNYGNFTDQHIAMLIQNKDNKWFYYSVNGDDYYILGSHSGGSLIDQKGWGKNGDPSKLLPNEKIEGWDNPQEFMDSDYNREKNDDGKEDDVSVNGYGFETGFLIPSNKIQDRIMALEFNINADKQYTLFDQNCSKAVSNALVSGGIKIYSGKNEQNYQRSKICFIPSIAFKNITRANPQGSYIYKQK